MNQPIYWIFILALPVAVSPGSLLKKKYLENQEITVWKNQKTAKLYITSELLIMTRYTLLYAEWRRYIIVGFKSSGWQIYI